MTGTDGEAIDLDEPRCTSAFVVPGETEVHHCLGRPVHKGVMHGDGKTAWGDDAAADNHPAEPLMIRTSELVDSIRQLAGIVRAVQVLHSPGERNRCEQCGMLSPCPTAAIVGPYEPPPRPLVPA